MTVAVIDYGSGNLHSAAKALDAAADTTQASAMSFVVMARSSPPHRRPVAKAWQAYGIPRKMSHNRARLNPIFTATCHRGQDRSVACLLKKTNPMIGPIELGFHLR